VQPAAYERALQDTLQRTHAEILRVASEHTSASAGFAAASKAADDDKTLFTQQQQQQKASTKRRERATGRQTTATGASANTDTQASLHTLFDASPLPAGSPVPATADAWKRVTLARPACMHVDVQQLALLLLPLHLLQRQRMLRLMFLSNIWHATTPGDSSSGSGGGGGGVKGAVMGLQRWTRLVLTLAAESASNTSSSSSSSREAEAAVQLDERDTELRWLRAVRGYGGEGGGGGGGEGGEGEGDVDSSGGMSFDAFAVEMLRLEQDGVYSLRRFFR
jgi:hypothetical protein